MNAGVSYCKLYLLTATLSCLSLGLGGVRAQDFQELQALLDAGYYATAAQAEGPKLVSAFPNEARAHYLYGKALYLSGDYPAAREALARARELADGVEVEHLRLEGLLNEAEGNLELAEEQLSEAHRLESTYEHAMDWARVAWQRGDTATALLAYDLAASTPGGRDSAWPQLNRARLFSYQGRYAEAVDALNQVIAVLDAADADDGLPSPLYVEAYFRLGKVYEAQENFEEAIANYEAALFLDPSFSVAVQAVERLRNALP